MTVLAATHMAMVKMVVIANPLSRRRARKAKRSECGSSILKRIRNNRGMVPENLKCLGAESVIYGVAASGSKLMRRREPVASA